MNSYLLVTALVAFFPTEFTAVLPVPEQDGAGVSIQYTEPLKTAKPKYARIIERTRNDRSRNSVFRKACSVLARRVFREECEDYGYSCPPVGADIMKWPAEIDARAIAKLKSNVPALEYCPDAYITEVPLPIRRFKPRVTCEMVKNEAWGWVMVDLLLNDEGNVVQASVSESTSSLLEDSAIESAQRFRYQKILSGSGYVEENRVQAIIYFDFDEVQKSGACDEDLDGS